MTQHLTETEIRLYRARALSPSELLEASKHLGECETCRNGLASPADLASREGELAASLRAPHLTYRQLSDHVDGTLPPEDAPRVTSHLRSCQECSDEVAKLEALKTEIRSRQQDKLPSTPANVVSFPTPRKSPRSLFSWLSAAAASIAVLAGGSWFWQYFTQNTPESLLAVAYTESRPFEFRLPSQGYGPIRQHRAGGGTSALDKPDSLLRAEADLKRKLKQSPEAGGLLLLRGRADLLDQEFDPAIESLTRARELNATDPAILADLGTAYALRGVTQHRLMDTGHAMDLLLQSLQAQPKQPAVLFNLALVYENMALFDEAEETWKQFLSVEKDSGWLKEAQQHIAKIEEQKKKRDRAHQQIQSDPAVFLSLARSDLVHLNAELVQDVAWRYWLPKIHENPAAREAFHTVAEVIATRLHDPSLLDAWTSAIADPDIAPLVTLSKAIEQNAAAHFEQAFPFAGDAAKTLAQNGHIAASLRARVELAVSRQRTSAGECFAVADPLVRDLQSTSYTWMHGQALLERSVCHQMAGELTLEKHDILAAYAVLQGGPFVILQLRAQSFHGGVCLQEGNLAAVWETFDQGLERCWQFGAPPPRYQQFDYHLSDTCKNLGWDQASAVFARASIREISLSNAKPIEALARVHAAQDNSHAATELAQAESTLSGVDNSTNRKLLFDARLTRAETDPPELSATRADLQQLQRDLNSPVVDWQLRVRFTQTLARSLAATGDDVGAARNFRAAIADQQRELSVVLSPLDRISRTETAAPAYKGLIALELKRKQDSAIALATWDAYRAAGLKQPLPSSYAARDASRVSRLIYIPLPAGVAAFAVSANSLSGQILKTPAAEIEQVQRRFLRACARPESDLVQIRRDGQQLYSWLIAPLLPQLANASVLAIDADGWLAGVPFTALVAPTGRYLVEDYAIAMSGSINTRAADRISVQDRALIVSIPSPGGNIPALHFASDETRGVATQLRQASVLSDTAASLEAIKPAIRFTRLFHFVGHGWSNAGDGGLILTNGTEPTYLTAAAISRLDWTACSLVVLSACMTGTGEAHGPFNPRSLVRAFLASGARRVVAARWNLDEAATATLMQHFYASVLNSIAPAEALALAERAILQIPEYRHPYYWSSFAIFGDL